MGNAEVPGAVGNQVASQLITINPPLFRSFQGEVAARLLPALHNCCSPSAAHLSKVLPILPNASNRRRVGKPGAGG
jgi:hypothetical protein